MKNVEQLKYYRMLADRLQIWYLGSYIISNTLKFVVDTRSGTHAFKPLIIKMFYYFNLNISPLIFNFSLCPKNTISFVFLIFKDNLLEDDQWFIVFAYIINYIMPVSYSFCFCNTVQPNFYLCIGIIIMSILYIYIYIYIYIYTYMSLYLP